MAKLYTDWRDSDWYGGVEPYLQLRWRHGQEEWHYVHTPKAMLCIVAGEARWVPYSQIGPDSEVNEPGDSGDLEISAWFAHKNKWPVARCPHGFIGWHRFPDYTWCEGPFRYD